MINIDLLRALMSGTDTNVERAMPPSTGNRFGNAKDRNKGMSDFNADRAELEDPEGIAEMQMLAQQMSSANKPITNNMNALQRAAVETQQRSQALAQQALEHILGAQGAVQPMPGTSKFQRGEQRRMGIGMTADDLRGEDDSGVGEDTRGLALMALLRQMERGYTPRQIRNQSSIPDEPMPDQYGVIPWRQ